MKDNSRETNQVQNPGKSQKAIQLKLNCISKFGNKKITSNASHCIEIWIYGIFELGPLYELLKRIVIGMVLSPTDELWQWHGFESWLATTVIGKGRDLKILILSYSLQVQ